MLENETSLIIFTCQAIGLPLPNVSWYFNGARINVSDSSKYYVSSDSFNGTVVKSSLSILNAQSLDVGAYTCQAENIIGIDRSSGLLTVNGKLLATYMIIYNVCEIIKLIQTYITHIHVCMHTSMQYTTHPCIYIHAHTPTYIRTCIHTPQ